MTANKDLDSRVNCSLAEDIKLTLCCASFGLTSCRRLCENEPLLLAHTMLPTALDRSKPHLFFLFAKARMGERQRVGEVTVGLGVPLNGAWSGFG